MDYDFDFVVGYIQGSLNTHWYNEYITKQSDKHKEFIACKAILEYLKFETLTGIRIQKIYNHLLQQDNNLFEIDNEFSKELIGKHNLDEIAQSKQYTQHKYPVYQFLENMIARHIKHILNKEEEMFLPELFGYFNQDEIEQMIIESENGF